LRGGSGGAGAREEARTRHLEKVAPAEAVWVVIEGLASRLLFSQTQRNFPGRFPELGRPKKAIDDAPPLAASGQFGGLAKSTCCCRRDARQGHEDRGEGSTYPWTAGDADNNPLEGGKTYKLHLPPNSGEKLLVGDRL
jgi:hypothetical protein